MKGPVTHTTCNPACCCCALQPVKRRLMCSVGSADCCDGSDEAPGLCKNACIEKGAAAREALRQAAKDAGAGNKVGAPILAHHFTVHRACDRLHALRMALPPGGRHVKLPGMLAAWTRWEHQP